MRSRSRRAGYAATGATGFVASIMTAPWESMLHALSEVAEAAHVGSPEARSPSARVAPGPPRRGSVPQPQVPARPSLRVAAPGERRARAGSARRRARCAGDDHDGAGDPRSQRRGPLLQRARRRLLRRTHRRPLQRRHPGDRLRLPLADARLQRHGRRSIIADPCILAAFVQESRTMVQAICDGHHVAPVMIDILHRTLGDPADPGDRLHARRSATAATTSDGGTWCAPRTARSPGSALHPDRGLRNLMEYASLPFERAIVSATGTPAKLLGLESQLGTLALGQARGRGRLERRARGPCDARRRHRRPWPPSARHERDLAAALVTRAAWVIGLAVIVRGAAVRGGDERCTSIC